MKFLVKGFQTVDDVRPRKKKLQKRILTYKNVENVSLTIIFEGTICTRK